MTLQLLHSEFPYIWGKFYFLFYQCTDLLLDVAVGVVDDGQEHVEEDKEHKEEVGHEEDGAQDSDK